MALGMAEETLRVMMAEIRKKARQMTLSDAELARRAGITPQALSRIGKKHGARFDTIEALARVVELRIGLLPDDEHARALAEGTLFDLSTWGPTWEG